jgi:hypothetical protein
LIWLQVCFTKEITILGGELLHFTTPSEVTHLEYGNTHNVLVAALRNGIIMVWELSNGTLGLIFTFKNLKASFHYPGKKQIGDRCPPICFVISYLSPLVYYARIKSTTVQMCGLFWENGKHVEYYHKKPVSSLCVHPSKELLVSFFLF